MNFQGEEEDMKKLLENFESNPGEPLSSHEIPERLWQKIGMDFKALGYLDFLDDIRSWKPDVVVDKTGPNDYNLKIEEAEYRRNRHQIRLAHLPTRELSQEQEQSSYDAECGNRTFADLKYRVCELKKEKDFILVLNRISIQRVKRIIAQISDGKKKCGG
ncbi:hypothetical protein Trydic_g14084 [Trypoxylus dichotomus]